MFLHHPDDNPRQLSRVWPLEVPMCQRNGTLYFPATVYVAVMVLVGVVTESKVSTGFVRGREVKIAVTVLAEILARGITTSALGLLAQESPTGLLALAEQVYPQWATILPAAMARGKTRKERRKKAHRPGHR